MKKTLYFFSIVCLIAALFISCSSETKLNETVAVNFSVAGSRALEVLDPSFISVYDAGLDWYYHGIKITDPEFAMGQSASTNKNDSNYWTYISKGSQLANTQVTFSQGQWYFELKAVRTTDNKQIYYGTTNGNVLLTKDQHTISISVSPFVADVPGKLAITSVSIAPAKSPLDNSSYVAPNKLYINGVNTSFDTAQDGKSISRTVDLTPGSYTVEFKRVGTVPGTEDEYVIASASKTVVIYSGLTTRISGTIDEDTTYGKFDPQPVSTTGSSSVPASTEDYAEVSINNVTPSMETDKATTVTIPTSILNGRQDVTLSVAVADYQHVNNESFNVESGKGVAASISLTMQDREEHISSFGDNTVTVETYIEKGLTGVSVKYNNLDTTQHVQINYIIETGDTIEAIPEGKHGYYNPSTGKLVFATDHFSEFYVEADAQAKIGTVEYCLLKAAVDAAQNGDTIELLNDTATSSQIVVKKAITIDLNEKTVTYAGESVLPSGIFKVVSGGVLTVSGNGTISTGNKAYAAIAVFGDGDSNPVAKLTIENGTFEGYYYPVVGNGTKHNTEITINDGSFKSSNGLCIFHPQNGTLTINGGSFEGQESAIEIRSGNLIINGGSFKATNEFAEPKPNGSGTTSNGVAIAVAQHTTKLPINVTITGGTFEGYSAFYESNPQCNPDTAIATVNLNITGGTFTAINNRTLAVHSEDKTGFIKGGTFSSNPSSTYIAEGYEVSGPSEDGFYVVAWDGTTATQNWTVSSDENYHITSELDLKAFANAVNTGTNFSGKTIILDRDIDLNNKAWTPVGQTGGYTANAYFQGTFDGNGKTISNLYIPESSWEAGSNEGLNYATGFFGFIDRGGNTIKNVTFRNANVAGHHWVGVAVGYMTGTVSNVTVTNSTITSTYKNVNADGDKAGGVVGYLNSDSSVSGCTVTGSTVSAVRDCGSVVGHSVASVTGNTAENCTVYYSTDNDAQIGGEIAGKRAKGVSGNTATNVTVAKVGQ